MVVEPKGHGEGYLAAREAAYRDNHGGQLILGSLDCMSKGPQLGCRSLKTLKRTKLALAEVGISALSKCDFKNSLPNSRDGYRSSNVLDSMLNLVTYHVIDSNRRVCRKGNERRRIKS